MSNTNNSEDSRSQGRGTRIRALCSGNTCRSPMLECLLNYFGKTHNISASSARARDGQSTGIIIEEAQRVLKMLGVPDSYVVRTVPAPHEVHDVIIILDSPHSKSNWTDAYPRERKASPGARVLHWEVRDPYKRGNRAYDAAYERMKELAREDLGLDLPDLASIRR